ncbi:glycosyltransferase family 2 protein [soil metagenome]
MMSKYFKNNNATFDYLSCCLILFAGMKLSIIIVNYNVKYFLEQCLYAVQQAMRGIRTEVFVVDNCSKDGSVEYLQQKFSWVHFITNERNEGFASANNIALKKCSGEFVLFLNPDTIVPEHIFTETLTFFKNKIDAGALGVSMLDGRGVFLPESKRAFPSPLVSFFKLSGIAAMFPASAFFNKYALGHLDQDAIHEVDVLCGAFMMIERCLLQKLNGFDESFFMYGEDIDLSYRIQQCGKKNYYLGHLNIVHFKGESIGNNKSQHNLIFYNAMNVFVKKHYRGMSAAGLKILLQTGIFLRAAISFLSVPLRLLINGFKEVVQQQGQINIYLVGDIVSTTEAEKIILKHKLRKSFKGSLLIEKRDAFISAKGAEIIFCMGALSFAETINIIKKYPKVNKYMWHGLYSNSIAGSRNKNENGTVYSIELKSDDAERNYMYENLQHADSSRNVQVSDTTGVS